MGPNSGMGTPATSSTRSEDVFEPGTGFDAAALPGLAARGQSARPTASGATSGGQASSE